MNTRSATPEDVSDEAIRRLARLRSGRATADDHADTAQWRAASPDHDKAFKEMEGVWRLASGLEQDAETGFVGAGRARPILAAAPGPAGASHRRNGWSTLRSWAVAAAVILGVGVALRLSTWHDTLFADFDAPTGQTRTVTLADGSTVTLDARSAFNAHLEGGTRRIDLLTGEALFRVQADPSRPFVVHAGGTTVTALGTEFDVARLDDGGVRVAVTEHAVSVATAAGAVAKVLEGQRIGADANGRVEGAVVADTRHVAAWRQGRLIAEGRPLSEVIAALSRYHRGWIILSDPSVANLSVSAVLDLHDPQASLQALSNAVPIRVRTLTPYVVIVSGNR